MAILHLKRRKRLDTAHLVVYTTFVNTTELEIFLEQALGRYVGVSHFSMIRIFARELHDSGINLTAEQCRLLFTLFIQDGRPQQEISALLFQEKSSTSRLVDSLERKGYVQRKQVKSDERQRRIFLTAEGQALRNPCWQVAKRVQNNLKEHFSHEEWEQLIYLTRKLSEVARNA